MDFLVDCGLPLTNILILIMARQRRSAAAAPRRTASTTSTSSVPATRPSAPPPVQHAPPATSVAQPRQPGMIAQMASTAAGVAIGSTVGHAVGHGITSMFSGGDKQSVEPPPQQSSTYVEPAYERQNAARTGGISCEADAKSFMRCMEQTGDDVNACKYYLDMLRQCQFMASQQ